MDHQAAIEDGGTPKRLDDPTLSDRAKIIANRVGRCHTRWLEVARWGADAIGRDPKSLTAKENMAVEVYYAFRKKITWPVWSTRQTDEEITALMFVIQATHARIHRLVPEAYVPPVIH